MNTPALPSAEQFRRWGVDPEWSRVVEAPGQDGTHSWHVLDRPAAGGVAADPTIVCVHGNPTWSYLWHSFHQRLDERYRVVAVDQLGMGFSERVASRRFAQRVDDLENVIDALGIDGPVVLAAHDWGGPISLGWARRHADRVRGIVLCNTGVAVPEGRHAPALIRIAASGPITDLVGHRTRTFVDGTLGLSYKRLTAVTREALRAPYRRADLRQAIADFVDDVPFAPDDPSATPIAELAEGIRSLTMPVLLTWGGHDPVFNDDFAADLFERLPHADRHRFGRAGHLVVVEEDVAALVDGWLRDRVADGRRESVSQSTATAAPLWSALETRRDDDAVAFVDGSTGETTSFAEMYARVTATAAGLASRGVRPGDRVAVLVPPSVDLLIAAYGCWRAGAVTVIADRGLGLRGLGAAVRAAHVDWVIGPRKALAAARAMRWAPGAQSIRVDSFGNVASDGALPAEPGPDDLAAVLYTSGATGPAKGVRYRHRQMTAQRDALAGIYGITSNDRLVAAFAPFALYGPALGIASTIPDVDVTKPGTLTAEALGRAASSVDATIVFAAPAALANINKTSGGRDPRLDGVRLVLSAGAPVPIGTLRSTATLIPDAELHTPYGMTECLPVADIELAEIAAAVFGAGVCVGAPVSGVEVLIAPLAFDAGNAIESLAIGETGEILVAAPWLSDGYDQLWRTEHDARPRDGAGRVWHRSGDVGHLDEAGRLWVEGRTVHVIDAVDGPITPVPVEVTVERIDGITSAAAVGVGPTGCQQLVVVIADPTSEDGLADEALAGNVRAAVGRPVAAVLTVASLPVDIRHNTKIDRTMLAEWASSLLAGNREKRRW